MTATKIDEEKVKALLIEYADTTEKEHDVVLWIVHKVEAELNYKLQERMMAAREDGLYDGKANIRALRSRCEQVQDYLQTNL